MRPLLVLLLLAACSPAPDDPSDDDDAGDDDDVVDDNDAGDDDDAAEDCGSVYAFDEGRTPTAELHVTTDGDDGGDGSLAAPFATVDAALRVATPGTAVRIHAGTYPGFGGVGTARGELSAPIWIGGAPGEERPVIEGGATGIQLVQGRYVVLHDLEVTGQTANGVNFDDGGAVDDPRAAHHLVFRNLWIHDVGSGNNDCLKLSGLRDFWVLDSAFARCGGGGSGSGVDMVGCHDGTIAYNTFAEHSANGIQAKGGTADVVIRSNRFQDAGDRSINLGGSTGFEFFRPPLDPRDDNVEAQALVVFGNVFEGAEASLAYVGCLSCIVANNTFVNPERWVLRILQETTSTEEYEFAPTHGGRFVNNIVSYTSGISRHVNVGPGTAADSFGFSHNLWFRSDDPAASAPDLPAEETDAVYGEDPGLDDAFRIPPTSPAAAAGLAMDDVGGDLYGECFADPPSIGAVQAR